MQKMGIRNVQTLPTDMGSVSSNIIYVLPDGSEHFRNVETGQWEALGDSGSAGTGTYVTMDTFNQSIQGLADAIVKLETPQHFNDTTSKVSLDYLNSSNYISIAETTNVNQTVNYQYTSNDGTNATFTKPSWASGSSYTSFPVSFTVPVSQLNVSLDLQATTTVLVNNFAMLNINGSLDSSDVTTLFNNINSALPSGFVTTYICPVIDNGTIILAETSVAINNADINNWLITSQQGYPQLTWDISTNLIANSYQQVYIYNSLVTSNSMSNPSWSLTLQRNT